MANSMDCIFVKMKDKAITLAEFLKIPVSALNESEQKIKEALTYLYAKNNENPPLFKEFPDRGKKKLTVDCTAVPMDQWIAAWYLPAENIIEFTSSGEVVNLISTLAHELKHAEQTSRECLSLPQNNVQYQQLRFVEEAQAYAFQTYISSLLEKDKKGEIELGNRNKNEDEEDYDDEEYYNEDEYDRDGRDDLYEESRLWQAGYEAPSLDNVLAEILQKHLKSQNFDYSKYEQEAISTALPILYCGTDDYYHYRKEFDKNVSIQDIEKQKRLDHIPASFHLADSNALLPILNRIPPSSLTKKGADTSYRYLLYTIVTGDYSMMEELLENMKFDWLDDDGDFQDYAVDKMIEDHREEFLEAFTENSYRAQYYLLKSRLDRCAAPKMYVEDILGGDNNLYDEDLVNEVFSDIDMSIGNIDEDKPIISSKSLSAVDKKKSEEISFCVNQIEKETDVEIRTEGQSAKLEQAIQYGHIKTTKVLLDSLKKSDPEELNKIFSNISSCWKNTENLPLEQQKYIQKNKKQILFAFLDMKDRKGQPVILPQSVNKLIHFSEKKEDKTILNLLSNYKKDNPTDKRFSNLKPSTSLSARLAKLSATEENVSKKVYFSTKKGNLVDHLTEKE